MTSPDEDLETRLTRILHTAAERSGVGCVIPDIPARPAPSGARRRRGTRRKAAVAAAAVAVALTGSAAAAAVIVHHGSTPVTEHGEARCYTVDSLAGGDNFKGLTVAASGTRIGAQVTNALQSCTMSWQDGFLVLGSGRVGANVHGTLTPNHPVPPLVVCVLPGGIAGVFPGNNSTCQSLGLPTAKGN